MTKRKVMSIIGLSLDALLIVCLFVPFAVGYYDGEMNLWDFIKNNLCSEITVIFLIEIIVSMVMLTLQICGVIKDSKLAMLPFGFLFTFCLGLLFMAFNNDGVFDAYKFGFYFSLIVSIIGVVVLAIGGLLSNEKKRVGYNAVPVGFNPQTGKPIYEAPKQIVGYDPQTGKPIYK